MLMTISEIQEKYHLSKSTLLNYEKSLYLRCYKTPGGHRRYEEKDIIKLLDAEKDEKCYLIRYDSFRPLPDTIKIVGSFTVGDGGGHWPDGQSAEEQMLVCGWNKVEMGEYRKQKTLTLDEFKIPYITVILQDKSGLPPLISEIYKVKKIYDYGNEKDGIFLRTAELDRLASDWQFQENEFSRVPLFLWGLEAHKTDTGVEIKQVSYDRVKLV